MIHEEIAKRLIYPLFRGIADGYKSKYSRSIWQQLENNIRSAARCSTLSRFLDTISQRLGIEIRSDDRAAVAAVVTGGEDKAVLKLLREDATTLVLLARLMNEKRRAMSKESAQ